MFKRQLRKCANGLMVATLLAIPCFAQERGIPIFQDGFDTKDTFAERWVPKGKDIIPVDGKVLLPEGSLRMRRDTPLEFYVSLDIALKEANHKAHCGFQIEGKRFAVTQDGNAGLLKDGALTDPVKIDGFGLGRTLSLILLRKIDNGKARYVFLINGKEIATASGDGEKANQLDFFSDGIPLELDNFGLFAVKGADDSPNLVINSSFEHAQDGFPLYFSRNWWAFNLTQPRPYEDYISAWSLDETEKHSGKQSLKIVFDETTAGAPALWAWGAATAKDMPGVFSVWMKADQEDFPVTIAYGKGKEVMVGKEWKRYEVVNPKLPAPGTYSPVTIVFGRRGGLWVDDLQAEIINGFDEEKFKAGSTFATEHRPSMLDKERFCKPEAPVRTADISVPKLPSDVVPNGVLDTWKGYATKLDKFYHLTKISRGKTEAYLACDNQNFYVGFRAFTDDLSKVNTTPHERDGGMDSKRDMAEILVDPYAGDDDFQYYQFISCPGGWRIDKGLGMDGSWDGEWKSTVALNEKNKCIDYEFTIPLATLASPALKSRWTLNLHRYDAAHQEIPTLIVSRTPSFRAQNRWPFVQFPADVMTPYTVGAAAGAFTDSLNGFVVSFDMVNGTGKDLAVKAELLDLQNAAGTLGIQEFTLKQGASTLAFNTKTKTDKVRLKLTRNGKPISDQFVKLEKRSPVSVLGRLSYYMNEPEALFKVKTNLAEPQKMTAVLECAGQKVETPALANFKIALPLKDIPNGTYDITLTLRKDGKAAGSTKTTLVKRPFKKGAAQINRFTRSLIHDGKTIFPIMPFIEVSKTFTKQQSEAVAAFLEKNGFRYACFLTEPQVEQPAVWFMDEANKRGIQILLWGGYNQILNDEVLQQFVSKFDYPNVFSQMVEDEAELRLPSDTARDFLRKLRPYFPYQPVYMNYTVLGIPSRYANLESDILMLDDYLTNTEGRTVESVVKQVDMMRKAGEEEGKPCYYFIAGGTMPLHFREPSYAEQIAQTYGCIAAGCTGLSYFYGRPVTPGNWKAYIQLNKEILSLTDILLSEEETAAAQSTGNDRLLRSITRKHEGYLYVVSCNIDENPAGEVTFTLPPEYKYDSSAEVLFENRKVDVKDGKFSDTFPGHARHVYKVKEGK